MFAIICGRCGLSRQESDASWNSHLFDPSNKLRESAQRPAIIRAMQTTSSELVAQTVSLLAGRRVLRVTSPDGQSRDVDAALMRSQCRCAVCTRARIDGTFLPAAKDIEIEQVTPIGQYGLNVSFSDGHARGIFPLAYLAELAAFQATPADTVAHAADLPR
jgi:DUF971 family protein